MAGRGGLRNCLPSVARYWSRWSVSEEQADSSRSNRVRVRGLSRRKRYFCALWSSHNDYVADFAFRTRLVPPSLSAGGGSGACSTSARFAHIPPQLEPSGFGRSFRVGAHGACIGEGRATFTAAVEALRSWDLHRVAGFWVSSHEEAANVGSTVVLVKRLGPVHLILACRVTETTTTAHSGGFSYRTLPLHVETGEQTFSVTLEDRDRVRFTVSSRSRPAHTGARWLGPLAVLLQKRAARRYVRAMSHLAKRIQ